MLGAENYSRHVVLPDIQIYWSGQKTVPNPGFIERINEIAGSKAKQLKVPFVVIRYVIIIILTLVYPEAVLTYLEGGTPRTPCRIRHYGASLS